MRRKYGLRSKQSERINGQVMKRERKKREREKE